MKGDFSRWTAPNAAARHYSGVLMQQGRLHTDADWNEQVQIGLARSETALADIIGKAGTSKGGDGFKIISGPVGFTIGAGRYYLDGAMVQNDEDVTYDDQGDDVTVPPLSDAGGDGTEVIVYVEATRAHVTGLEDTRLIDPALSGDDTAMRIKAAWRVGVEAIHLTDAQRDDLINKARCGGIPSIQGWGTSTGAMSAQTLPAGNLPDDSDCRIPPEAGYLSQENQLYRVEIIAGGTRAQSRFVWSRENGAVEAILARNTDGDFILQGVIDDKALGFKTGDWVEVYDAADVYNGRSGHLRRITLTGNVVVFSDTIDDFAQLVRPRVRRWDQTGNVPQGRPLSLASVELERGIEVSFINGTYRTGDYWVFEARAATGNIVWPQFPMDNSTDPVPPMGWGVRRAPLALARISGPTLSHITDLRAEFPTLTCLHAEDVEYDDSQCQMGASTVQQALDILCRKNAGHCTLHLSPGSDVSGLINALPAGAHARICFEVGQYEIPATVQIENKGNLVFEGAGPGTELRSSKETIFMFKGCRSVMIRELSVQTRKSLQSKSLNGPLTFENCRTVTLENLDLECGAGFQRMATCLTVRNDHGQVNKDSSFGHVRVLGCRFNVGHMQTGMLLVNVNRATIEDNFLTVKERPAGFTFNEAIKNFKMRKRFRRLLISDATANVPGADARTNVLLRVGGKEMRFLAPQGLGGSPIWEEALRDRPQFVGTKPQESIYLLADSIIRDPIGLTFHFDRWRRQIETDDKVVMGQGIVVGGRIAKDIRILNNTIDCALQGIHVGLSHSDPTRSQIDSTRTIMIHGNSIHICLPSSAGAERHGIFVGNSSSISMKDNWVSLKRFPSTTNLRIEAVRIFGYLGNRMIIEHNHIEGTHNIVGIRVTPIDENDPKRPVWRISGNVASVEAPDKRITKHRNFA